MEREASDPVVVAGEGMKVLACLTEEQFDQFVPSSSEDECLEVVTNSIRSLFAQFFKSVHPDLRCKLMFQELAVHQFSAGLSLHHQDSLNDIIMCEKSENWGLLIDVPNYHALVI